MAVTQRSVVGQWWAEAWSQGLEDLTKFGLYLEGTGELWKTCEQGSAWEPELFLIPDKG